MHSVKAGHCGIRSAVASLSSVHAWSSSWLGAPTFCRLRANVLGASTGNEAPLKMRCALTSRSALQSRQNVGALSTECPPLHHSHSKTLQGRPVWWLKIPKHAMNTAPRSAYDRTGGLVYFARMLDKIRLRAASRLAPDCHANLGAGFDARCCRLLGVTYDQLCIRMQEGGGDEAILEWCQTNGSTQELEAYKPPVVSPIAPISSPSSTTTRSMKDAARENSIVKYSPTSMRVLKSILLLFALGPTLHAAPAKPNIVFILADDLCPALTPPFTHECWCHDPRGGSLSALLAHQTQPRDQVASGDP